MLRWATLANSKLGSPQNRKLASFGPTFETLENRFVLSAASFVPTNLSLANSAAFAAAQASFNAAQTILNATQANLNAGRIAQPPQALGNSACTTQNTCTTIDVLCNDRCTNSAIDPKSVKIVGNPIHGTVKVDAQTGCVTYTPCNNYTGCDTFCYTVKDKSGRCSNVATCCVTVSPPVCPPTACNDSATTCKDTPVKICVLANDRARVGAIDPKTVKICGAPAHGTTSVDPCTGQVTYTPESGYCGSDTFTYKVKDCCGNWSNVASVCVTVGRPKQSVDLCNASVCVTKNCSTMIKCGTWDGGSDCAPDWNTLCIVQQPCHGTVKVDSCTGKITYTPSANYCGSETFTYQVKDWQGRCSNVATCCVTVAG